MRGLSPYPGAWATFNGKTFKISKCEVRKLEVRSQKLEVGELDTDDKTYLYVKTSDGWISIEELQPEGKKKMTIQEFLRGNKI